MQHVTYRSGEATPGRFKRSPKFRRFMGDCQRLARAVLDEDEPDVVGATNAADLSIPGWLRDQRRTDSSLTNQLPLAELHNQTKQVHQRATETVTPADAALFVARTFVDSVALFDACDPDSLDQVRAALSEEQDWNPIFYKQPWQQALIMAGSLVDNDPDNGYARLATVHTVLLGFVDPDRLEGRAKSSDGGLFKRLRQRRLGLDPAASPLPQIHKTITANYQTLRGDIDSLAVQWGDCFADGYQQVRTTRESLLEALAGRDLSSPDAMLGALSLEKLLTAGTLQLWEKRPRFRQMQPLAAVTGELALHEALARAIEVEGVEARRQQVQTLLTEHAEVHAPYELSRTNFRKLVDPDSRYVRQLMDGFGSELVGRARIAPVDKSFARDFLTMMYVVNERLATTDHQVVFDELLEDAQRLETIRTDLEDLRAAHRLERPTPQLQQVLSWYLANELILTSSYIKLLPDFAQNVIKQFDAYWNETQGEEAVATDETKQAIEPLPASDPRRAAILEIINKSTPLNFRVFPPGVSMSELRGELEAHLATDKKALQRVEWERLETMHELYLQLGAIDDITATLYRALPGSLKQKIPYFVLELKFKHPEKKIEQIVTVGDNPLYGNAAYAYAERPYLKWRELYRLSKANAQAHGAEALRHPHGSDMRRHRMRMVASIQALAAQAAAAAEE
ncbi:MAG TPA: hypothetical protein VK694_06735 [Verrucomicrobiae bacterium]|nr:hypothetical protein [Verrucomicrobiae bacterium]